MTLEEQLEKLYNDYYSAVEQIANEQWRTVVLPFFIKHDLELGWTWDDWFVKSKTRFYHTDCFEDDGALIITKYSVVSKDDIRILKSSGWKKVFRILQTKVPGSTNLGRFMSEKDTEK